VTIHSARPGVVIGKKGADIEKLRKMVAKLTDSDVVINISKSASRNSMRSWSPNRSPSSSSAASRSARAHEARRAVGDAAWRGGHPHQLLGPSRRRRDCPHGWYREGACRCIRLRADVDFGVATAFTTYGTCGVKVWIFKGEIMEHDPMAQDKKMAEGEQGRPRRDAN